MFRVKGVLINIEIENTSEMEVPCTIREIMPDFIYESSFANAFIADNSDLKI
jgi:hypothetical protein